MRERKIKCATGLKAWRIISQSETMRRDFRKRERTSLTAEWQLETHRHGEEAAKHNESFYVLVNS